MPILKPAYAVLLLALAACTTLPNDPAEPNSAYRAAISDAAVASPRKIVALLAQPPAETLSVVSLMSANKLPSCSKDALPCVVTLGDRPLWVTLSGEVQVLCRRWKLRGEQLQRRLDQLLGMPVDPPSQYREAVFVEFRVARQNLARPCLGVDASDPARPVCTLDAQPTTPATLRALVGRQMAESYVVDRLGAPGYPFTRLGYTYDWAPTARADHYGASEFIVTPTSTVEAVAVVSTDDYCRTP
ncbi:MAG: hypothetical protein H6R17_152 [Proteobacteria bacterium]|nr:hypothetical protein [Pseudomonadota bacterium]